MEPMWSRGHGLRFPGLLAQAALQADGRRMVRRLPAHRGHRRHMSRLLRRELGRVDIARAGALHTRQQALAWTATTRPVPLNVTNGPKEGSHTW